MAPPISALSALYAQSGTFVFAVTLSVSLFAAEVAGEDPKYERSPFTKVTCLWDAVTVEYDGHTYKLVSIEGISAKQLLEFCRREYGLQWKKRFSENLVGQVLTPLGKQPSDHLSLVLEELQTGKTKSIAKAPLTRENRQAVYQSRNAREDFLLSPFTDVHCKGNEVNVEYENQWYELETINDIPAAAILIFCKNRYREFWEKRVAEDLVQILQEMGHYPQVTVRLTLRDPETHELLRIDAAPLTFENRQAVWRQRNEAVSAEQMHLAVRRLAEVIRTQWAYKDGPENVNYDRKLQALHTQIDRGCTINELSMAMHKLICSGRDGHAQGPRYRLPVGSLPFRIAVTGDRFVPLVDDRLLDQSHPFLVAIDGVEIETWIGAVQDLVPRGSPQFVRVRCIELVAAHINFARRRLTLPERETIELVLAAKGGGEVKREVDVASAGQDARRAPPSGRSRVLGQNIGYLRLTNMGSAAVHEIREQMDRFRDTHGLIIDVRGNGGGSRDALKLIFSYLAGPNDPPRVVNCAKLRLYPNQSSDVTKRRHLFPEDSPVWSDAQRDAIQRFMRTFRPEWTPADALFSEWHYMVLGPGTDASAYHYNRPVVVLMDEYCFSATDVFLAALKTLANVTLIGTPSSGGSSAAGWIQLTGPFRVNLGTMVSYQVDGKLFDGHGVQPDVRVVAVPELFMDERDNVLEAAVQRLNSGAEQRVRSEED